MVRVQPLTKGLTPSSCVTRRKDHVNKIGFEDLEPYKTAWFSKKEYRSSLGLNDLEPYKTA